MLCGCHQLCLPCPFDTWVFPGVDCWSRGQVYVSFTLVLTEKTSLTHPWPHFRRTSLTFFFLFMILERVILSSWLPWASVLRPASWAFSLPREPCSVKFVSFSNSSLCNHPNISLHSSHCFLALLPSALFSGPLPTSLCAPATQGGVGKSVLQFSSCSLHRSWTHGVSLAVFVHTYMYMESLLCFLGCSLFPGLHPHWCDPLTTVRFLFLSRQPHPVS